MSYNKVMKIMIVIFIVYLFLKNKDLRIRLCIDDWDLVF